MSAYDEAIKRYTNNKIHASDIQGFVLGAQWLAKQIIEVDANLKDDEECINAMIKVVNAMVKVAETTLNDPRTTLNDPRTK